jgi:hypothetical protein
MVRSLLFILFSIFFSTSQAQELKWIYKIGGVNTDYGNGLAIDSDQNIYDITNIQGTVSVSPILSFTSRGEEDILIRKSTSLGILQWVRQIGGIKQDLAYDVAVDDDKNVFVVGTFVDTLYLGAEMLLVGSPDRVQSFVLKLSAAGTMLWVRKLESNISNTAKCVTAGTSDELVISGTFEGTANFGVGFPAFSDGGNDIFVLKLDGTSGEPNFIRRIGGTDQEYVHKHVRDQQNNIYLTGDFRSSLDLDPGMGAFVVTSNGLTDAFLIKLSNDGVFRWGKTYGSAGVDYGTALATDIENNVLIAGRFSDNISLGSLSLQTKGGSDIFLAKIDHLGNTVWVNSFGDTQNDQPSALITNNNGIIYLGGTFRGKVDFDPSAFNNSSESKGGTDVFIAVYNQDGSYNDHFSLGGIANDQLADLVLKSNGELISNGGFGAIADFDPTSSEVNIFSNGSLDAFLWNTFICINPYIKSFSAQKTILCPGEKVFIQIDEGYLNDATQWSWQRDSCKSITFASGDFLNVDVERNTTFFVKGFGGCVVNDPCKKIDIKVFKDSLVYQNLNLCQGDSIIVGNNTYTFGGVFIDSLQSVSGCDSVVVTEISIFPTYSFNFTRQICNGDTVKVGNFNYTLAGTYVTPLSSIFGCDSIIRTTITVLPSNIDNVEATLCKGDSIRIENVVYKNAGVYIQTSIGSNGCEDQLIIKINLLETNFTNVVSICQGDSVIVGNSIYKTDGIFTDKLISSYGCDSTITTILTILSNSEHIQEISFCEGDSILVGNNIYKQTGNFIDTLTNVLGCDSVVYSNVRVYSIPAIVNQSFRICEGDSIIVGNKVYVSAGIYEDTLMSVNGCDSVVITTLTVDPKSYTQTAEICQGEVFQFGNEQLSVSGNYLLSLKNIFGCDSIITLSLKVNPTLQSTQSYIICPGNTVSVGDNLYSISGTYLDTLQGVTGCDSIVTSIIGYNHVDKILNFEICKGESIIVNNKSYAQAGIFRDTLLKSDGCDSILVISMIVHPTYNIDTTFEICKGGSIIVGNSTYFNAGNFTEILQTKKGCDSLVNFEIRIINFVPIFSVIRDTLRTVKLDGALYQWLECRNGDKVPFLGAVSPEFIILKSGQYSLSITYKGCTYFSDCIDIILSSSEEYFTTGFKYFPNPVSGVLSLETESIGSLKIVSIFGQVYSQYQINALKEDIDLKDLVPGTYYLIFESQNKKSYHKLIKL